MTTTVYRPYGDRVEAVTLYGETEKTRLVTYDWCPGMAPFREKKYPHNECFPTWAEAWIELRRQSMAKLLSYRRAVIQRGETHAAILDMKDPTL